MCLDINKMLKLSQFTVFHVCVNATFVQLFTEKAHKFNFKIDR